MATDRGPTILNRVLSFTLLGIFGFFIFLAIGTIWHMNDNYHKYDISNIKPAPIVINYDQQNIIAPAAIRANNGEELIYSSRLEYDLDVKAKKVPKLVMQILGSEDRNFFNHDGVDWWALLPRLIKGNGASTIEMQLLNTLFPQYFPSEGKPKNMWEKITGKLLEIPLAQKLDKQLIEKYQKREKLSQEDAKLKAKEEILNLFINNAIMGNIEVIRDRDNPSNTDIIQGRPINGFPLASKVFIGKDIKDLNHGEIAQLMSFIKRPKRVQKMCNGPDPQRQNADLLNHRNNVLVSVERSQKFILELPWFVNVLKDRAIRRDGLKISPNELENFKKQDLGIRNSFCNRDSEIKYPLLYNYLLGELSGIQKDIKPILEKGNIGRIITETTINERFQSKVDRLLKNTIENKGRELGFNKGAVVVMNSKNGNILSLASGQNFRDGGLNYASANLVPGSVFKLFTYLESVKKGISADLELICKDRKLENDENQTCQPDFREGEPVRVGDAVKRSSNPMTLAIAERVGGYKEIDKNIKKMNIEIDIEKNQPQMNTLGLNLKTKLLTMTKAYAIIANGGKSIKPHAIASIKDAAQNCELRCQEIWKHSINSSRVVNSDVARKLRQLLQLVVSPGGTGEKANLGLSDVFGKTGTAANNRFFIGAIPSKSIVAGVWLGNDRESPGSSDKFNDAKSEIAAEFWARLMRNLYPDIPPLPPIEPPTLPDSTPSPTATPLTTTTPPSRR
jgi:membrane peptidoglycan carboxypeptidase